MPIHVFRRWSTCRHGPKLSWTVHYWLGSLRWIVALHHSWILTLVVIVVLTRLSTTLQLLVSVLCLLLHLFLNSSVPRLAALDLQIVLPALPEGLEVDVLRLTIAIAVHRPEHVAYVVHVGVLLALEAVKVQLI